MKIYPQLIEKNGSKNYILFSYEEESADLDSWIHFHDLIYREIPSFVSGKIFSGSEQDHRLLRDWLVSSLSES